MTEGLDVYRRRLDALDDELIRLFGERFAICRQIARHKSERGISMMQPDRVAEVRERYARRGAQAELPADFTLALCALTIDATCRMEDALMAAVYPAAGLP